MRKIDEDRVESFLNLLQAAPTAWHLCDVGAEILTECGFTQLEESSEWALEPEGKYFVIRNGASLAAFVTPKGAVDSVRLMGSHSDSPGLKVKPHPDLTKETLSMIGVEVYGSPLLSSWLNRDLKVAGRVICQSSDGERHQLLLDLADAPVTIPQLAIHLDRAIKDQGVKLDKQQHLPALAAVGAKIGKSPGYLQKRLDKLIAPNELLAYDLFLVPTEAPARLGERGELIASHRLDNVSGFHASLSSLLSHDDPLPSSLKMLCCWDSEEIGSRTAHGAASPFAANLVERIILALGGDRGDYLRSIPQSLCISIDVAHAWHPSFDDRYDPEHRLLLGGGVALKINANQRYISDADVTAELVSLAKRGKVEIQMGVNRNDQPAGSTIGPIHAAATSTPTIDIGVPLLSMHSARELIHIDDQLALCRLLDQFLYAA